MNPEGHYFAELFDGNKTENTKFSCNREAVDFFVKKYGTNLLAVKRVDASTRLVYCA